MATSARPIGELTRQLVAEIKAVRTRKNLTQPELAELAGIPAKTYEKIERLERPLGVEQLGAITDAFEVSLDAFVASALANARLYRPDANLNPEEAGVHPPGADRIAELLEEDSQQSNG
ncbi:helix-turn-helix domain-containing protein [Nocardia asiatica]|uniref:helix-turn-helix domain-containing protein n=1 Tax=Nocardia asiatica TaxID=209252 RepID=UPI00030F32F8|nr:helix-turn-helix transcriptional regulator [Nocardia asiatica]